MLPATAALQQARQVSFTLFRQGRMRARLVQEAGHELSVVESWLARVGLMVGDELELEAPAGRLVVRIMGETAVARAGR
jgi:hypothetical protein